jgi:hypothetical protein
MNTHFTLVTLTAVLTLSAAQAQTCKPNIIRSAPDSRYQLVVGSGGSEVLDTQTKLIWQRCSLGQTWNGTTCTGTATVHTWTDALAKAKAVGNGYRLPNIKELQSLVEEACYKSSINEIFFPATPSGWHWSASPVAGNNNFAWRVSFDHGSSDYGFNKDNRYDNGYHVRAVRASQ